MLESRPPWAGFKQAESELIVPNKSNQASYLEAKSTLQGEFRKTNDFFVSLAHALRFKG